MFVSELHHCLERHATIWKQSRTHLLWCQNDMVHHLLQPFFGCNEQVRMVYKLLLWDVSTTTEEKNSFEGVSRNLMQRYIDENKGDELCYETGAQGVFVATMTSENSWSKRLVGCLRNILPKLKVMDWNLQASKVKLVVFQQTCQWVDATLFKGLTLEQRRHHRLV